MTDRMFALATALALAGAPIQAQATAPQGLSTARQVPLSGQITSSAAQPLQGVVIQLLDLGLSGMTNSQGRYLILLPDSVVGRSVTVRTTLIGYGQTEDTVQIGATGAVHDIQLEAQAVQLEGVVVTGTAIASQRREIGIDRIARAQQAPMATGFDRIARAMDREQYARIDENGWKVAGAVPLSTFSIDVDRASYANVRRFLNDGQMPPADAVRIEELVNYFPYADPAPEGAAPFSITTELTRAPWNGDRQLLRIALKGKSIDMADAPAANLVFLMDVSGSMNAPDKLPLLKTAFRMLVESMRPQDRVAIVVYAGSAGEVLPSTSGNEKPKILEAIERLRAGGSTAGGAGIELAYRVAAQNHIPGGNNRVILATDGDFNVGASSDGAMIELIEEKREQGTFLTVLGFGTGNLQDAKMEQIADHGNGSFHYIDSALEARKSLVSEAGGTLVTIARDVKIQVEFNPATVESYRLIGYENRLLADEDFNDDTKDAGELGAGHSVVAMYEIVPAGGEAPASNSIDDLRYSTQTRPTGNADEVAFVKLRYKQPEAEESQLLTRVVDRTVREGSRETRFAAAVAAWGMLLRGSDQVGEFQYADVLQLATEARGPDQGGYRSEFIRLVDLSAGLATQQEGKDDRLRFEDIGPGNSIDLVTGDEIGPVLESLARLGTNGPLVYIDGQRASGDVIERRNTLLGLDAAAVERIEIIRGAAARTLYGADAGVVQIFRTR